MFAGPFMDVLWCLTLIICSPDSVVVELRNSETNIFATTPDRCPLLMKTGVMANCKQKENIVLVIVEMR